VILPIQKVGLLVVHKFLMFFQFFASNLAMVSYMFYEKKIGPSRREKIHSMFSRNTIEVSCFNHQSITYEIL
jgi:hypothetical protein